MLNTFAAKVGVFVGEQLFFYQQLVNDKKAKICGFVLLNHAR